MRVAVAVIGMIMGLACPAFAVDEDVEKALKEAIQAEIDAEDSDVAQKTPQKKTETKKEESTTASSEEKKSKEEMPDSKASATEKEKVKEKKKPAPKPEKKAITKEAKPAASVEKSKKTKEKSTDKTSDKSSDKPVEKSSAALAMPDETLGEFDCPSRVPVATQKLESGSFKNFSTFSETERSYWLRTVQIYSGDKQLAVVDPARSTESSSEWILIDNGKVDYYFVCGYQDTSLKLKKQLASTLKTCMLSAKPDPANPKGRPQLIGLSCQ